jgi:hypothetical protein
MKSGWGKFGYMLAGALLVTSWGHADQGGMNESNQPLWKSKSENEVLKKMTRRCNQRTFKAKLSRFGKHEWVRLSREERKKAMDMADNTQLSPDDAVFTVAKSL